MFGLVFVFLIFFCDFSSAAVGRLAVMCSLCAVGDRGDGASACGCVWMRVDVCV